MMETSILKIENLSKSYFRNTQNKRGVSENERFHIIKNLQLEIPQGKTTALIGGNGAGKTTLFNILSRFIDADQGSVMYMCDGWMELLSYPAHKLKYLGIGRLFQDNHIFPNMSVMDNMLVADNDEWGEIPFQALLRPQKNREFETQRVQKAEGIFAEIFGQNNPYMELKDSLASDLSFGQQRLLGLARLFMGNYRLLLLDEPTAGVNPETVDTICRVIRTLEKEKQVSIFLIEHNMQVVERVADYCNFMSHGMITAFGIPEDVIGDERVRNTYLGI